MRAQRRKRIDEETALKKYGRICGIAIAVLALVPIGAALARAPKKMNLTAHVTKAASSARQGDKIVLALDQGSKNVGSARFPSCEGTGTSFVCGGTVSVDGIGSNLSTLITFECPPKPPFKCLPGVGGLETKSGAVKGTITLKTQPEKIVAGASFPAIVAPAPPAK
jgi:hypothetical protein